VCGAFAGTVQEAKRKNSGNRIMTNIDRVMIRTMFTFVMRGISILLIGSPAQEFIKGLEKDLDRFRKDYLDKWDKQDSNRKSDND
jgi:hypothetical protein